MEAFINELSYFPISPSKEEGRERARKLALCLKKAREHHFTLIRCHEVGISGIQLSDGYSLADFCNDNLRGIQEVLLMSMIRPPYFQDNSEEEAEYIIDSFLIDTPEGVLSAERKNKECIGLAAAYLKKSIGINLVTHPFWIDNKVFQISRRASDVKEKGCSVYAFCNPEDFERDSFIQWQVACLPRLFVDCGILPQQKRCSLSSDHHGNDTLRSFAQNSLFILPYVSEVVTSCSYHPYYQSFVKNLHFETGRIEVVLHWTEQGLGMLVQTTARTDLELRQIADELEQKFGGKKGKTN